MKTSPSVILLCGFCGAGKDSFADRLMSGGDLSQYTLPDDFPDPSLFRDCLRLSFASRLKDMYCAHHSISSSHLEDHKTELRMSLIEFATDIRKSDDAYFARQVLQDIEASHYRSVLITDLRFRVEYDTITSVFPHARVYVLKRPGQLPCNESDLSVLSEVMHLVHGTCILNL